MKYLPSKTNVLLLLFTLFFLGALLEIFFRFLPVNMGLAFNEVNENQPYFRSSLRNRNITASFIWDLEHPQRKHINNDGFVNKVDYDSKDKRPLVAVVGDSYVEALQVNDDEPFYQILSHKNPDLRFYSFGFSGAPLSQYLIWAQYAKTHYHNKYLIINVVGNDFDESLATYKMAAGFFHYQKNKEGKLQLKGNDYKRTRLAFILHSSFARYLIYNLQVLDRVPLLKQRLKSIAFGKTKEMAPQSNNSPSLENERERDSYQAIDAFLRDLPQYTGLKRKNIYLVVDGMRADIYTGNHHSNISDSYFAKMRTYLFKKAKSQGVNVIDMHPAFVADYQKHHHKFEFKKDGHWNAYAHSLVAETINKSLLLDSKGQ